MEANLIDRDVAEDYFGCSDWEILAKETLRRRACGQVQGVQALSFRYRLVRSTIIFSDLGRGTLFSG